MNPYQQPYPPQGVPAYVHPQHFQGHAQFVGGQTPVVSHVPGAEAAPFYPATHGTNGVVHEHSSAYPPSGSQYYQGPQGTNGVVYQHPAAQGTNGVVYQHPPTYPPSQIQSYPVIPAKGFEMYQPPSSYPPSEVQSYPATGAPGVEMYQPGVPQATQPPGPAPAAAQVPGASVTVNQDVLHKMYWDAKAAVERAARAGTGGTKIYFNLTGPGGSKFGAAPAGYEAARGIYLCGGYDASKPTIIHRVKRRWASHQNPNGKVCYAGDDSLLAMAYRAAYERGEKPQHLRAQRLAIVQGFPLEYVNGALHPNVPACVDPETGKIRPMIWEMTGRVFTKLQKELELIGALHSQQHGAPLNVESEEGAFEAFRIGHQLAFNEDTGRPWLVRKRKTGPRAMDVEWDLSRMDPMPLPMEYRRGLSDMHPLDDYFREASQEKQVSIILELGWPMPPGYEHLAPSQTFYPPQGGYPQAVSYQPAAAPPTPNPYGVPGGHPGIPQGQVPPPAAPAGAMPAQVASPPAQPAIPASPVYAPAQEAPRALPPYQGGHAGGAPPPPVPPGQASVAPPAAPQAAAGPRTLPPYQGSQTAGAPPPPVPPAGPPGPAGPPPAPPSAPPATPGPPMAPPASAGPPPVPPGAHLPPPDPSYAHAVEPLGADPSGASQGTSPASQAWPPYQGNHAGGASPPPVSPAAHPAPPDASSSAGYYAAPLGADPSVPFQATPPWPPHQGSHVGGASPSPVHPAVPSAPPGAHPSGASYGAPQASHPPSPYQSSDAGGASPPPVPSAGPASPSSPPYQGSQAWGASSPPPVPPSAPPGAGPWDASHAPQGAFNSPPSPAATPAPGSPEALQAQMVRGDRDIPF